MSNHQGRGCDNGNKFKKLPHPPSQPKGRGQRHKDSVAGLSKPKHQGQAPPNRRPMKKWSRWEPPQELRVSSPNNIGIQQVPPRIDQEQDCSVDNAKAPEHSLSPSLTEEAEGNDVAVLSTEFELIQVPEVLREQTPSEHWEDGYDQTEEEPNRGRHTLRNDEAIHARARTPTGPRATTPGDARLGPGE